MNNFINRAFFSHSLKQARDGTFDSDRTPCDGDQVTSASHICYFPPCLWTAYCYS